MPSTLLVYFIEYFVTQFLVTVVQRKYFKYNLNQYNINIISIYDNNKYVQYVCLAEWLFLVSYYDTKCKTVECRLTVFTSINNTASFSFRCRSSRMQALML